MILTPQYTSFKGIYINDLDPEPLVWVNPEWAYTQFANVPDKTLLLIRNRSAVTVYVNAVFQVNYVIEEPSKLLYDYPSVSLLAGTMNIIGPFADVFGSGNPVTSLEWTSGGALESELDIAAVILPY